MTTNPLRLFAVQSCAVLLAVASLHAAEPQLTAIAKGLDNPRGLSFAPNGKLYVAEAGLGAGDGHGGFGLGVGLTGAVSEISGIGSPQIAVRRVATGLVSIAETKMDFPRSSVPMECPCRAPAASMSPCACLLRAWPPRTRSFRPRRKRNSGVC